MYKTFIVIAFVALTFAGCKSKQDQLVELNAQFDALNAQYQKDCSTSPSAADDNAILGTALGNKPSSQQQSAIDQRQREAETRKNSPHCTELGNKRDELTRKMLASQSQ